MQKTPSGPLQANPSWNSGLRPPASRPCLAFPRNAGRSPAAGSVPKHSPIACRFPVQLPNRLRRLVSRSPVLRAPTSHGAMGAVSCAFPPMVSRVIPRRTIGRLRYFSAPNRSFGQVLIEVLPHPEKLNRMNGKLSERDIQTARRPGCSGNKVLFPNLRTTPDPLRFAQGLVDSPSLGLRDPMEKLSLNIGTKNWLLLRQIPATHLPTAERGADRACQ